jgi:predicted dinucleotide-binding enzyme
MNIAIIGSGNVGTAIARSAARAGHAVTITSRDVDAAEKLAQSIGAHAVSTNREAMQLGDITFLAVPAAALLDVIDDLGGAVGGKVLVDVTNRPTPNPDSATCTSIAEEIQARTPDARVVKAMNTVFAARQEDPEIGGRPADGYVAGDDAEAKRTVLAFVESIGLTPYDVGPLAAARTLEGMAWIHISLAMENNWPWQSAWRIIGPKG